MRPSVRIDSVTRAFGVLTALDGVSLEVGPGEIHALLGPNGAGKTTLLRLLSGSVLPTFGNVDVLGLDAAGASTELRRLVGVVPAGDRSLYLRISALENLVFFGRLQGLRRREAKARAVDALDRVGLAGHMRRPVNRFSHGMQKRVAFARALLTEPPVLLVDEATHDLDPEGSERIRELTRGIARRGTAVLWATQRLEEINGFADRVTVLDSGVVRFAGTVSALAALAGARRYVLDLRNGDHSLTDLNDVLGRRGRLALDGRGDYLLALDQGTRLGEVLSAIEGAGVGVVDCREERSRLEGVFLTLIEREAS